MSCEVSVLDKIECILELPCSTEEHSNFIQEFHQTKLQIILTFSSVMEQIQKRKQGLLDQLDSMERSWSLSLRKQCEQIAEIKGKLKCCLEISKNMDAEGLKKLEGYAAELLHSYNDLQQAHQNSLKAPRLMLEANKEQLAEMIAEFGKLTTNASNGEDDGSDCSWDLASCDLASVDMNETVPSMKCSRDLACCNTCSRAVGEIENIDAFFTPDPAFLRIADVCKANEVCGSFAECICDVACYRDAVANSNPYVEAVERECLAIMIRPAVQTGGASVDCDGSDVATGFHAEFEEQVSAIEKQFLEIMSFPAESHAPLQPECPVNAMTFDLRIAPHDSEASLSDPFPDLTSQLQSILNGETPMYGLEDQGGYELEKGGGLPLSVKRQKDKSTAAVPSDEKVDPEKRDPDVKPGWCSVQELHSIVSGILSK